MIKQTVRKDNKLLMNNRVFIVKGIWYIGNKPTQYEIREIINGVENGAIVKKSCNKIDPLIEDGSIIIEK